LEALEELSITLTPKVIGALLQRVMSNTENVDKQDTPEQNYHTILT